MTNFWTHYVKPWSKEQCKRRYVEGCDEISIRRLADDSGVPKGTVERWCRYGDWFAERKKLADEINERTREKIIEKTSDILSEHLAVLAEANQKAHKLTRDYAVAVINVYARNLQRIQQLPQQEQLEALRANGHDPHKLNFWSQILARSTQGIESATGLPYYVNLNTSFHKVSSEGYVVIDPEEEKT